MVTHLVEPREPHAALGRLSSDCTQLNALSASMSQVIATAQRAPFGQAAFISRSPD